MTDPTDKAQIAKFIADGKCDAYYGTISKRIYYLGPQWLITSYGLERRDAGYALPKAQLNDPHFEAKMIGRESTDAHDFWAAMRFAYTKFKLEPPKGFGSAKRYKLIWPVDENGTPRGVNIHEFISLPSVEVPL